MDILFLLQKRFVELELNYSNTKGERFMLKNDPRAELAPRDIVARGIQSEIEQQKEEFVWLDGSEIDKTMGNSFPNHFRTCKNLGISLPKDPYLSFPLLIIFVVESKLMKKANLNLKGFML